MIHREARKKALLKGNFQQVSTQHLCLTRNRQCRRQTTNTTMDTANRCSIGGGAPSTGDVRHGSADIDMGSSKLMSSAIASLSQRSFHDRRTISRAGMVSIGNASVIVKAKQSRPTNNSGSESSKDNKILPVMCPSGVQAAYNDPEKPIAM